MQAILSDWTIVLLGQWNPSIFSPTWLSEHVFNHQAVEMNLLVGQAVDQMRISTGRVNIIPSRDRVIIGVLNTENETLAEADRIAVGILTLLTHTPIRATGINFGFRQPAPSVDLSRHFNLSDNPLLTDAHYQPSNTAISRRITHGSNSFNFKMDSLEDWVHFHFNFHQDVGTAQQAVAALQGRIINYRDLALRMLRDVYHLELEQEVHV